MISPWSPAWLVLTASNNWCWSVAAVAILRNACGGGGGGRVGGGRRGGQELECGWERGKEEKG